MNDKLMKLLEEYKETERSIELVLDYVEDKNYGKGKLEIVKMVIADLEKLAESQN